jgi:hypothetical protein
MAGKWKERSERYRTQAAAFIPELCEGETLLKDISITGCCIESTVQLTINVGQTYHLHIEPEQDSGVDAFDIDAEARWETSSDFSCVVGFLIIESPNKKKFFMRYVDYLTYRENKRSE